MTRSAEEIERDAEATRADLDRTVEALKEKMNPSNIASEMMTQARNTPTAQRAIHLGRQAKDNSLPLALVGAGLAWMMFNRNRSSGSSYSYESRTYNPSARTQGAYGLDYDAGPESGYLGEDYEATGSNGSNGGIREKVRGVAGSAKGAIGGAAGSAKEAIGSQADKAKHAVSSARQRVSSTASTAAERAREVAGSARQQAVHYGHRAEETFLDTLEREPLIIGGLGLAVGAAVGMALPRTPIEDRYVGPLREKAWDQGRTRAKEGFEQAKEVATAAAHTLKEEADRQGVTDVQSLVEKAKTIARAGVDTAKQEVETRRGH